MSLTREELEEAATAPTNDIPTEDVYAGTPVLDKYTG